MPSFELFDEQPQKYRDEVLPPAVTARVGGRSRHSPRLGQVHRLRRRVRRARHLWRLGAVRKVYQHRGITAAAVVAKAKEQLQVLRPTLVECEHRS